MIQVKLSGEFQFSDIDILQRNYEKSIMIDCWMTVIIDSRIYFDDWVCPLELYLQYLDWRDEYLKNDIKDFHYISDDNGKNPILSFILIGDKWAFNSCLTDIQFEERFSIQDVLSFFKSFEMQLLKHKV